MMPLGKALAEPVYLACESKNEQGEIFKYDITIDEQNRKITYTYKRAGTSYNTEGFFSANEISFKHVFDKVMTSNFAIDRTNLSLIVTNIIGDKKFVQSGGCEIVKVADRKI